MMDDVARFEEALAGLATKDADKPERPTQPETLNSNPSVDGAAAGRPTVVCTDQLAPLVTHQPQRKTDSFLQIQTPCASRINWVSPNRPIVVRAGTVGSPGQVKLLLHEQSHQQRQQPSRSSQVQKPVARRIKWISPTTITPAAASRPTVIRAGSIASRGRIMLIAKRRLQNQQPPVVFKCQQTQRSPLVIARQPLVQATPPARPKAIRKPVTKAKCVWKDVSPSAKILADSLCHKPNTP